MVRFLENHSLKTYNTFGIDASAKYFFEFTDIADLHVFLDSNKLWRDEKLFILGGGSNILFTRDFNGLIIHPNVPGIEVLKEDRQNVWVRAGAGEEWDEFVHYCILHGYGGLENLSLIPGAVGAAPVQNIGAYGREVENFIESVTGFDLQTMEVYEIPGSECRFGYRDSIFKNQLKGRFVVASVIFKLDKFPEFELSYGDVEKEVKKLGEVCLRNVRQAVANIRTSRLPDVKNAGNAGSFFKNPVVTAEMAGQLKEKYPSMPVYPAGEGKAKLAAGWLIDQCGWRGYRKGDAGVHEKQALVIVNYGNATGNQIFWLSERIRKSVVEEFGVELQREVNVV